jgi:hypothetical protein
MYLAMQKRSSDGFLNISPQIFSSALLRIPASS